jgi:putative NADH-flavin reductase
MNITLIGATGNVGTRVAAVTKSGGKRLLVGPDSKSRVP